MLEIMAGKDYLVAEAMKITAEAEVSLVTRVIQAGKKPRRFTQLLHPCLDFWLNWGKKENLF